MEWRYHVVQDISEEGYEVLTFEVHILVCYFASKLILKV